MSLHSLHLADLLVPGTFLLISLAGGGYVLWKTGEQNSPQARIRERAVLWKVSFISIAGLFIVGNERLSLIVAMVLLFLICAIIYFSTEKKLKENFTDQP